MSDPQSEPAQPLAHLGYYSDPGVASRPIQGVGGADLGSAADEWGIWALLAFIGAVAAVVGAIVQLQLTGVAVYFMILAVVLVLPLVWGSLPSLAIAFPISIAVLMAVGLEISALPPGAREPATIVLIAAGVLVAAIGIRQAVVRYFAPPPVPAAETAKAVFHWDD